MGVIATLFSILPCYALCSDTCCPLIFLSIVFVTDLCPCPRCCGSRLEPNANESTAGEAPREQQQVLRALHV
jgi:hypothetical protein